MIYRKEAIHPQQETQFEPDSTAEAIAEVVDINIARRRQEVGDFLYGKQKELEEIESMGKISAAERNETKLKLQYLLKELNFERNRNWEDEAVSKEMIKQLEDLITRAKKLESKFTSKAEKALRATGKVLMTVALAFGFKAGMDKFHSFEAMKAMAQEAQSTMADYEPPEIPRGMFVMAEEDARKHDTSVLFDNFVAQSKELTKNGIWFINDDKSKDFEKIYIAYADQFEQTGFATNFTEAYNDHVAKATDRTPEQMEFVADVARDALFAKVAGMGGIAGALYEGQVAYDTEARKECLEKQYHQGLAFLDRIFTERLRDVAPEVRNEIKEELADYLRAEVRVRLDMATIKDNLERGDVDGLIGREARPMVPGRKAAPAELAEDVKAREKSLDALYAELDRLGIVSSLEGTQAKSLADWHSHFPVYQEVANHLQAEMDKGMLGADGELLVGLLDTMKRGLQTAKETYAVATQLRESDESKNVAGL